MTLGPTDYIVLGIGLGIALSLVVSWAYRDHQDWRNSPRFYRRRRWRDMPLPNLQQGNRRAR